MVLLTWQNFPPKRSENAVAPSGGAAQTPGGTHGTVPEPAPTSRAQWGPLVVEEGDCTQVHTEQTKGKTDM